MTVDVVLPHLFLLADDAAHLAVVEIDVAVAEAQDQQIHSRAHHLVHRPLQHVDTGGRFDALAVKVMGVVVVDQAWFLHLSLLLL
jgi:hypothetical protein